MAKKIRGPFTFKFGDNQIDDIELLHSYDNYFKNALNAPKPRASKKIGFLGNVNDYKKTLEKIYKDLDSYERNA